MPIATKDASDIALTLINAASSSTPVQALIALSTVATASGVFIVRAIKQDTIGFHLKDIEEANAQWNAVCGEEKIVVPGSPNVGLPPPYVQDPQDPTTYHCVDLNYQLIKDIIQTFPKADTPFLNKFHADVNIAMQTLWRYILKNSNSNNVTVGVAKHLIMILNNHVQKFQSKNLDIALISALQQFMLVHASFRSHTWALNAALRDAFSNLEHGSRYEIFTIENAQVAEAKKELIHHNKVTYVGECIKEFVPQLLGLITNLFENLSMLINPKSTWGEIRDLINYKLIANLIIKPTMHSDPIGHRDAIKFFASPFARELQTVAKNFALALNLTDVSSKPLIPLRTEKFEKFIFDSAELAQLSDFFEKCLNPLTLTAEQRGPNFATDVIMHQKDPEEGKKVVKIIFYLINLTNRLCQSYHLLALTSKYINDIGEKLALDHSNSPESAELDFIFATLIRIGTIAKKHAEEDLAYIENSKLMKLRVLLHDEEGNLQHLLINNLLNVKEYVYKKMLEFNEVRVNNVAALHEIDVTRHRLLAATLSVAQQNNVQLPENFVVKNGELIDAHSLNAKSANLVKLPVDPPPEQVAAPTMLHPATGSVVPEYKTHPVADTATSGSGVSQPIQPQLPPVISPNLANFEEKDLSPSLNFDIVPIESIDDLIKKIAERLFEIKTEETIKIMEKFNALFKIIKQERKRILQLFLKDDDVNRMDASNLKKLIYHVSNVFLAHLKQEKVVRLNSNNKFSAEVENIIDHNPLIQTLAMNCCTPMDNATFFGTSLRQNLENAKKISRKLSVAAM